MFACLQWPVNFQCRNSLQNIAPYYGFHPSSDQLGFLMLTNLWLSSKEKASIPKSTRQTPCSQYDYRKHQTFRLTKFCLGLSLTFVESFSNIFIFAFRFLLVVKEILSILSINMQQLNQPLTFIEAIQKARKAQDAITFLFFVTFKEDGFGFQLKGLGLGQRRWGNVTLWHGSSTEIHSKIGINF